MSAGSVPSGLIVLIDASLWRRDVVYVGDYRPGRGRSYVLDGRMLAV